MPEGCHIVLTFDPYGIYDGPGTRVSDLAAERRAFAEINLRLVSEDRTAPLVLVVGNASIAHFESYRKVSGIRVEDLSPRSRAAMILGQVLPVWLNDGRICEWGLLGRQPPVMPDRSNVVAMVAEWLIPGIATVPTMADWLRAASDAPVVAGVSECPELWAWHVSRLEALLQQGLGGDPVGADLVDELRNHTTPTSFAREWTRRRALLPLQDSSPGNPLRRAISDPGGVRSRVIAKRLPLVFPLFSSAHTEVSDHYVQAVRMARNANPECLEAVARALNALWGGVESEIVTWVQLRPSALTANAIGHLSQLPGCTEQLRRVLNEYGPPTPVSPWRGVSEGGAEWVTDYARWLRTSFLRRQLPEESSDPATGFSRWLKTNLQSAFSDPRTSYFAVAARVRSALSEGRTVIVTIVDAMAFHVSELFRAAISDSTGCDPTGRDFLLGPVPTITDVCKTAIITGRFPSQGTGDLLDAIRQSYGLAEDQVLLAGSWEDPARLRVSAKTRLVVYRDNRIDDRLHTVGSYSELLRDCESVAERIAVELRRLITDIRCLTGSNPLLLLTADHGFTYGPPPGPHTVSSRPIDPAKRCVALTCPATAAECSDDSLTLIGATAFHTGQDYLAARGRCFGSQTVTGWKLAHGGLLPEEVLIPLYEWYGAEIAVQWPSLEPVGEAYCEHEAWHVRMRLRNRSPAPILGGELRVCILGGGDSSAYPFGRLSPSQVLDLSMEVPAGPPTSDQEVVLETSTAVVLRDGSRQVLSGHCESCAPSNLSNARVHKMTSRVCSDKGLL